MRNILNLLLTGVVFWVGNEYFNEYISILDTKTLIIATLLMFGIGYLFSWLMLISMTSIVVGIGCITTPILFLAIFILTPIKLLLLDKYLVGFNINGFWTYILLTIALSIFSISVKTNRTERTKAI